MAKLDPFHYPIPKEFSSNTSLRPLLPWVTYLHKWLMQAWLKLGGSNDAIADQDVAELYPWPLEHNPDRNKTNSYNTQFDQFIVKTITTKTITRETYTAQNDSFIYCKDNATLIMPERPTRDSVVYLTKDSTPMTLRTNGKPVDGKTGDIKFYKPNLSRQIYYFADAQEWRII